MNSVIIEYWSYLVVNFMGLCLFGAISIKKFKNRNKKQADSVFASRKWYKYVMFIADYGVTILIGIYFLTYVLDLPFAIGKRYCVKEGTITHVYKTGVCIDGGSTYTAITTNLHEGTEVKVYYLPFTKKAPVVEIIE